MSLQFSLLLQDFAPMFPLCFISAMFPNACLKIDGFSFLDTLDNGLGSARCIFLKGCNNVYYSIKSSTLFFFFCVCVMKKVDELNRLKGCFNLNYAF